MRERYLALVWARVTGFIDDPQPAMILNDDALLELLALLSTVEDPSSDLEVARASGWLYWLRYLSLGDDEGHRDRDAALSLLEPVYQVSPDAVPDSILAYLADPRTSDTGTEQPSVDPRLGDFADESVAILRALRDSGDTDGLSTLIGQIGEKASTVPATHPDYSWWTFRQGAAHRMRFELTGLVDDLYAAISLGRRAAENTPDGHSALAGRLANLSFDLQRSFEQTGELTDLNEAIERGEQAMEFTNDGHPLGCGVRSNLAVALHTRFEQTGAGEDLERATQVLRALVDQAAPDDPNRPAYQSNLGVSLQALFQQTNDVGFLDEAIAVMRDAVATYPDDDLSEKPGYRSNLGGALHLRYKRTGNLDDLAAAVTELSQAIADIRRVSSALPNGHSDEAMIISNLSDVLLSRSIRYGTGVDLDQSIKLADEAVTATPAGHPNAFLMRCNLGAALGVRFQRIGDRADLDRAIEVLDAGLAGVPRGHPMRARLLSNLSLDLGLRFDATGQLADLDKAIDTGRQAVEEATPIDAAGTLENLSLALLSRFGRIGDQTDIDGAVAAIRKACDSVPEDHPSRGRVLSDSGIILRARFTRTEDVTDIEDAIAALRLAEASVPEDHPDRAGIVNNLGLALADRADHIGDPDGLDESIRVLRASLAATVPDDSEKVLRIARLGEVLFSRFLRTGDRADLDESIERVEAAIAATPAKDPTRANRRANLSLALRTRYALVGNVGDAEQSIEVGLKAAKMRHAAPSERAAGAASAGLAAAAVGQWNDAAECFDAGIRLLSELAPRSLQRSDQEHQLEEFSQIGSDAAACCVRAGRPDRAVELFEYGRGVLLSQALDTRTDVTRLAEHDAVLAQRFIEARGRVDAANDPLRALTDMSRNSSGVDPAVADEIRAKSRRAAAASFERVVTQIRAVPGFQGFLDRPPLKSLLPAAAGGTVVAVTVSEFGSYALIVTASGVGEPVPLPAVTPDAVVDQVTHFLSAVSRADGETELAETLVWLWDKIAGPVLDRLGILEPPSADQWPKVWWCLSGWLSFLPLHAAGHHETQHDPQPATVIDRVISSYTPTLRALLHACRPIAAEAGGSRRCVAVAMPHTPGAGDLPGAREEVERLAKDFPGEVDIITGPQATRDAVLPLLRTARWAHFACHGQAVLENPSTSRLLLYDHDIKPLTVMALAGQRLDQADLAFLSACETARPGGRLINEAIHLASGFQLAGYRHVIATLWPIVDDGAVEIAADIYHRLKDGGAIATAVHAATRRMRKRYTKQPSIWASHIHSGA